CRDEVLTTMGVDELVVTNVTSMTSGELKISVKRVAKGAPPKDATTSVPAGQPPDAKMNADIGPPVGITPPPHQNGTPAAPRAAARLDTADPTAREPTAQPGRDQGAA